ncbi:MAG TPA: DUF4838 domain-containing protein [Bryobacteraceae bacterium]
MDSRRGFIRKIGVASLLASDSFRLTAATPGNIAISPDASRSEKWAAEQLGAFLEQMTGLRPRVLREIPAAGDGPVIAVGRSSFTDRAGVQIPEGESCRLKADGRALIIAGGRERGTMYGVFCFLEKLGCRWYTADVARIPRLRSLSMRAFDESISPAFAYREVFFTEAQGREWSARNRLNGNFHQLDESVGGKILYQPFAHSFYDLVPPAEYSGSHPEYFALFAGQRRKENAQLCLSNSDVVRIANDRVRQWLKEQPAVSVISISQNDGGGWCECKFCRQIVQEEGGAMSGLLLRFVNQIARSNPDVTIDTLAYQATADPPAHVRPLPNVQIRLSPIEACQAHLLQPCVYNQKFHERLSAWSRIAPRLILWQYSMNFSHYLLPFPNERAMMLDIPRLHQAGVSGVFVEGAGSGGAFGENAELRSYLAARLLWNPGIDANAEIHGFLDSVYGSASPWMRRYFELRYRDADHLWIDQGVTSAYLTGRFLRDGRALLGRARALAETPAARARIDRQLLSLDYIGTMRGRRFQMVGDVYSPGESAGKLTAFVQKATSLGITQLREGYPIEEQAREFEQMTTDYPVVKLDDGVAIIPALGARVLWGTRFRTPDPGEYLYPAVGGLYVNVASRLMSRTQSVVWRTRTAASQAAFIEGESETGLKIELEIRVAKGALTLRTRALNPGPDAQPVVLRCQAEMVFDKARLEYSGKTVALESAPASLDLRESLQEWTVVTPHERITNRFRSNEVERCVATWSPREPRQLILSLVSPETILQSGDSLILSSDYSVTAAAA